MGKNYTGEAESSGLCCGVAHLGLRPSVATSHPHPPTWSHGNLPTLQKPSEPDTHIESHVPSNPRLDPQLRLPFGRSAISAHEEALTTIPRKAHERDEVRVTEHAQDADLATWSSDFRVLIKDGKSPGEARFPKQPETQRPKNTPESHDLPMDLLWRCLEL